MKIRLTLAGAVATMLSAIGLYPLFQGTMWAWSGLGAIIVVAGTGLATRRFRLPALVSLACGLAALHLYLTLMFTADQALFWIIPTPSSLSALARTMQSGWDTANKYAAPVPNGAGVRLLATLGIGAVALMVDFLAVRLRRAAPAGLPLLAMYSVPAAVRQESVGWLAFVLGAGGFMALLLADAQEQVSGWGRHIFAARWSEIAPTRGVFTERPDSGALGAAGRRIGLGSLALALAIPAVIPGIHPKGLFGMGGGTGTGSGTGLVTTPDPLVALRHQLAAPSDTLMLTYTTDDPNPDYLRLYALDQFNGETWSYDSWASTAQDRIKGRDLPAPPGLDTTITSTKAVTTRISLSKKVKGYGFLPLPYAPRTIDIKGDWRVHAPSLMVFGYHTDADGKTFTVSSTRAQPEPAQLREADDAPGDLGNRYLRLPEETKREIDDLSRRIGKGSTDFDKALALQKWFTSGTFTYTLAPPAGSSDLIGFLFNTKSGDCEQFATAMAAMARDLGIPSRVAVGFTAGTKTADRTGEWEVRSGDAHAWPELYFQGAGWVRFEPTPSGIAGTGQGTATVPNYAAAGTGKASSTSSTTLPSGQAGPSASASPSAGPGRDNQDKAALGAAAAKAKHGSSFPWTWVAIVLPVLLLLSIPMLVRLGTRRHRWSQTLPDSEPPPDDDLPGDLRVPAMAGGADAAETAHAAWAELRADVIDHGLPWRINESPRAAAHRLAELLELSGGAAAALERIARAEERARYAPSPAPSHTLRSDVRTMREAFASGVTRRARLRARLAPPTALATLRAAGTQALETFDHQAARLRTRLPHR